jgi:hypothetical protein
MAGPALARAVSSPSPMADALYSNLCPAPLLSPHGRHTRSQQPWTPKPQRPACVPPWRPEFFQLLPRRPSSPRGRSSRSHFSCSAPFVFRPADSPFSHGRTQLPVHGCSSSNLHSSPTKQQPRIPSTPRASLDLRSAPLTLAVCSMKCAASRASSISCSSPGVSALCGLAVL